MRDGVIALLIALVAVLVGIGVFIYEDTVMMANTDSPVVVPSKSTPVLFTELAHGSHSSVTERKNYVISSAAELSTLWKMIDAPKQPPSVDFATDTVIAIFAGKEPSAGYSISVGTVADSATDRTVTIVLSKPGASCLSPQVVTEPYQIIEVPKTALHLTHQDSENTISCLQ